MSIARATLEAVDLPFQEAIDFFAAKVNVPTKRWTDLWEASHARAFSVAGAMKDALIEDFRREIAKALSTGSTLADFAAAFDEIVQRHGWKHSGPPGWRARIIYETNLSMAYSAGAFAQATDPGVLAAYPFWQYVHSGNPHPRLQHLAWDGLTLLASDPWWSTHWPPNGFNCGCHVMPTTARAVARAGKSGPDPTPGLEPQPYVDRKTGAWKTTPKGIDPGFGYNVGEAWRGRPDFSAVPPAPPAPPLRPPGR